MSEDKTENTNPAAAEAPAPAKKRRKAANQKKPNDIDKKASGKGKAKNTAVLRELAPIAKEVNARFESADKMDAKADDHRLSAAIRLAEAKDKCEKAKINFKKWCEENVKQSYETCRKLVPIGQSSEPAAALADMRNKNKKANKAHRDAKKSGAAQAALPSGKKGSAPSSFIQAEQTVLALDDKDRHAVVEAVAARENKVLVDKTELKRLQEREFEAAKPSPKTVVEDASLAEMQKAFGNLKATDKMMFVSWAAEQVGVKIVNPLEE